MMPQTFEPRNNRLLDMFAVNVINVNNDKLERLRSMHARQEQK